MRNIFDFIAIIKTYLNQKFENDFWIDPKHAPYGTLLLKSITSNKKIIFKPIDNALPIGGKRIHKFIINTPTFKKNSIDNYIIVARKYKENAIKLTESNKQLTLLAVDFVNNKIMLFGSKNIDMDLLKSIKAFSNYFDEMELKKNKARKILLQEKIQYTESHTYNINWWNRPNRIDPRFSNRYVTVALAITILVITLIFLPRNSDKEYDEFIDTRAKMMMLKEKGLATDKDIKRYEDAYYKSRRNK